MAQRRMFSPDIVSSDAFLDMPVSSQALYFHLGMAADDDGFVNPKKIMRTVGVSDDDLKVLLGKRFLLPFESGVVVIKHWLIHNMIRKDRYKETMYTEEKASLATKENGAYTQVETTWQPDGNQRLPQVRLGKVRLGKNLHGDLQNVSLNEEEYAKLIARYGASAINKLIGELSTYMASAGKKYSNHYATLLNWAKRKGIEEVRLVPKVEEVVLTPDQLAANVARGAKVREALAAKFKTPTA